MILAKNCETGIAGVGGLLLCVDCGTSYVKTLLLDPSGFVPRKYDYAHFPYAMINSIIRENHARLIVTGARADMLGKLRLPVPAVEYSEMACLSRLCACVGLERAVVACVGTGTPFVVCENGTGVHFGGTGVGGGTFAGLSARLLGITEPARVETLAAGGSIRDINITIGELYESGVSYLKSDYTAANFAKTSGGTPADVALGIHSLVSEVVGMMASQIARAHGISDVVFCGTVCENSIIADTMSKCLELFGQTAVLVENPGFGVCFGAAALCCDALAAQSPDTPATSDTPDTSDTPATPATSDTPDTPATPATLATPDTPDTPASHSFVK